MSEADSKQPNEKQFKNHFVKLLNPSGNATKVDNTVDLEGAPDIPVLDSPFALPELTTAIKSLNLNKSFSGVCPGLFVQLPAQWLMIFLSLFNVVLFGLHYPLTWAYNKLVTLLRSVDRLVCSNYKGIRIIDTIR